MFLTDNDYAVVIGEEALKVVSRASAENRYNAEMEAVEEMAGYLRSSFDCDAIFTATGSARNPLVVMRAVDIALYHLVAAMPQKMGCEIRKERYDLAIKWLEGVQAGRIVPDLPAYSDKDIPVSNATVFHSDPKLRHDW